MQRDPRTLIVLLDFLCEYRWPLDETGVPALGWLSSVLAAFRAICCQTISVLYFQIAVLGTAQHWINIQLISGHTLIPQLWLQHTGLFSGGKLSMSRMPAEAVRTDHITGQTRWHFLLNEQDFVVFFFNKKVWNSRVWNDSCRNRLL